MSSRYTYATGTNAAFIESLYSSFKEDPESVDLSWRKFFEGYEFALASGQGHAPSRAEQDHAKIEAFINTYRRLGHLAADLNPLAPPSSEKPSDLKPENHGLKDVKQDSKFLPVNFAQGREMTFAEIVSSLQKTYCGHIGADFREVNNIEAVVWLQEQMEQCENSPVFEEKVCKRILEKLAQAEGFEKFLQARYLGQKRFSLEGLESLIPLLDSIFSEAAELKVEEICMGMAHRGRLNVLANIMQKPYTNMLQEFEGSEINPFDIDGDVKYHLGFGSKVETLGGKSLNVYLSPNPSHLEAVNPVVVGFTRCRQDLLQDSQREKIMSVLLHGDASFIGQGIVTETLNLSGLSDYEVGGTIHIITNNQIGFTTNPGDSRSCTYSSDISKIIRAPVFHVNADHPEAVVWVAKLAVMYRKKFGTDVVIDLVGYRKHGHNETDEPSFTQPLMYKTIAQKVSTLELYGQDLVNRNIATDAEVKSYKDKVKEKLQRAYEDVKNKGGKLPAVQLPEEFKEIFAYKKASRADVFEPIDTKVSYQELKQIGEKICSAPDAFKVHPKLKRVLKNRIGMLEEGGEVDWAFGELLAFGALAAQGYDVRLSGQDCKRGTFTSRHGVYFDYETGEKFEPLNTIGEGKVDIVNSPLSEQGCLGFEFGFSVANSNALVLWEAQFGDFANGAQIIIDQFIAASEAKWNQTSGITLLLPHGFEGMGPEHSSARPERFLQCSGNLNIQVCNVTTPAQLFHLLRRQVMRKFRKPLVIMTPKSLLRHPKVKSKVSEFNDSYFSEVIEDHLIDRADQVKKVICCTGKIYYELLEMRSQYDLGTVPIVRVEQLYPFPFDQITAAFDRYKNLKKVVWVQEEPQNMGGWHFIRPRLKSVLQNKAEVQYVGRKHSGTTAEGSGKAHQVEQERILDEAFGMVCAWDPVHGIAERKKLESL